MSTYPYRLAFPARGRGLNPWRIAFGIRHPLVMLVALAIAFVPVALWLAWALLVTAAWLAWLPYAGAWKLAAAGVRRAREQTGNTATLRDTP